MGSSQVSISAECGSSQVSISAECGSSQVSISAECGSSQVSISAEFNAFTFVVNFVIFFMLYCLVNINYGSQGTGTL